MEHIKIINRDAQKHEAFYEMPLVSYEKENVSPISYSENTMNDSGYTNTHDETEALNKMEAEKQQPTLKGKKQRLSYFWIEAFFCGVLLLGILIIQNVKNTEDLQLDIRQQIRHNLTANELITVGDNIDDMLQKYKNVRP